jgi:DNA gyrase/topoisomerase IV subunit A
MINPDYQEKQANLIKELQLTRLNQALEIFELTKEVKELKERMEKMRDPRYQGEMT